MFKRCKCEVGGEGFYVCLADVVLAKPAAPDGEYRTLCHLTMQYVGVSKVFNGIGRMWEGRVEKGENPISNMRRVK